MTPRRRVRVQRALGRHHRLEVAETTRRGHATRLARAAANDGVEIVVVAAGDGTLNEAANGLVGTDTALAPLPGGSTNVFARTLGIHNRLDAALDQLIDAIECRSFRRVGVGVGRTASWNWTLGAPTVVLPGPRPVPDVTVSVDFGATAAGFAENGSDGL